MILILKLTRSKLLILDWN